MGAGARADGRAVLLAEGDLIYTVTEAGQLFVHDVSNPGGPPVALWNAPLGIGSGGFVYASPALDCNRPLAGGPGIAGKPGVLYVASTAGVVTAIIVDSPKLDTSAEWPKFQHDATNSGNPAFPLNPGCP